MMIWCKENSQLVAQFSELKDRIGSVLMSIRKRVSKLVEKVIKTFRKGDVFTIKK